VIHRLNRRALLRPGATGGAVAGAAAAAPLLLPATVIGDLTRADKQAEPTQ